MASQDMDAETFDPAYQRLYTLGGVAAWLVVVLTVGEVIAFAFNPQFGVSDVVDWFMLFQRQKLVGLMNFWGLEIPMYIMFTVVFLALYIVLRKVHQSYMVLALTFALLGVAIFLATNNPFAMLTLSNQYAAATTDAHKAALLAAGQALLVNTGQRAVGGFNIALFLVSVAGLMIAWVMSQGDVFNRSTAYWGMMAHALSLADYVRQALTSSEIIALLVILPNALCLVIWFILVGRRLYQLGRCNI